ncbi:hypothetical protein [Massilia aerilata]|uniref:Uncharacterized protein n=1 Tax=Massilia aerilata TaxID=453817 RepID=A0ABW0S4L6_9BURK
MYPTNPVATLKPAVVHQLNIFGDVDEIPVNPPKPGKAKPPGPAPLHDAPAPATKAAKPVKSGLDNRPVPTPPAPAKALPAADELLVDPDEPVSVDLEAIETSDTPETILAKRMFLRMMWDIEGKSEDVEPDLFGQASVASDKTSQADLNRLDALIWLYSLNPDGGLVTVEWVCDVLGFDPHRVRRIVGRSLRKELKRVVHLLSTIVGAQHAQVCEDKISDYLDISNWSFN